MTNHLNLFLKIHRDEWRTQGARGSRLACVQQCLQHFSWSLGTLNQAAAKRLLDIVIALAVLIFFAPLLLVISLLVKLDGGPALFLQTRIGQGGRPFRMFKFRSMEVNAEALLETYLAHNIKAQGVTFKLDHDPRVTRVGAIIRRFSVDEIPQFINVLAGEMSIVGPRPALPREVILYSEDDRRRLRAKPGLTCLWQIGERRGGLWEMGDRNKIDFKEQVALDVRYLDRSSLLLDLRIMLKTVPAMFLGK